MPGTEFRETQRRLEDRGAFLFFAAFTFLYFFPVFFLGKSLLIENMDHGIIFVRFADRAHWISQGVIPLWNPREFAGRSFVDEVPPTHLLNLQAWVMGFFGNDTGYGICIALFVFAAGFGMYLLCRNRFGIQYGFSLAAGSAAAITPMVNADYAALFSFVPFAAFYYYHFLPILEIRSIRSAFLAGAKSSIPLILCVYTVEPRSLEAMFWSSLVVLGTACLQNPRERTALIGRAAVFGTGAALFFFLGAAPILVPMVTEALGQQRLGAGALMPPVFTAPSFGFLIGVIGGLIFPVNDYVFHDGIRLKALGSYGGFYGSYIHILFVPAVIFLAASYRRLSRLERTVFVAGLTLWVLIKIQNHIPGLMWIWTYLFKSGRFLDHPVSFFLCLISTFIALNRFHGSRIHDTYPRAGAWISRIWALQILIAAAAAAAIAVGYAFFDESGRDLILRFYPRAKRADFLEAAKSSLEQRIPWLLAGYFSIAIGLLAVLKDTTSGERRRKARLVAALCAAPFFLGWGYWPFNSVPILSQNRPEALYLNSRSLIDKGDIVDFQGRKDITKEQASDLISNFSPNSLNWFAAYYAPSTMKMLSHFVTREADAYRTALYSGDPHYRRGYEDRYFFYPQDNNLFHLLGVNFFLSQYDVFAAPFLPNGRAGEYFVYENPLAAPRYDFADTVVPVQANDTVILRKLLDLPYAAAMKTAFVAGGEPLQVSGSEDRSARLVSFTPNRVEFETKSGGAQFFMLRDAFDPRWRALLNGEPVALHPTNYLFRGVPLPPGRHRLTFEYSYPEFRWYLAAAVLGLSGALIILFTVGPARMPCEDDEAEKARREKMTSAGVEDAGDTPLPG